MSASVASDHQQKIGKGHRCIDISVTKFAFLLKYVAFSQWMASGVTGLTGRPAQSCVVQVSERGPEPVPNRPQPMAENNALVEIGRHRSVMFNHAQVRYS